MNLYFDLLRRVERGDSLSGMFRVAGALFVVMLANGARGQNFDDWTHIGNGNWSQAANWSNGLPGPSHDVRIGISPIFFGTVTFDPIAATISSIESNNPFVIGSGSLTLTSTTVDSWFRESLDCSNGTLRLNAGNLHFAGLTTWSSASPIIGASGHLFNEASGIILLASTGSISQAGAGLFDNFGSIFKGGTTNFTINSNFNNSGEVHAQQGNLLIGGNGTHTGLFDGTGGSIVFIGGTQSFAAGSSTKGNVVFGSGSTVNFANGSNIGGNVEIDSGSTANVLGGTLSGKFSVAANGLLSIMGLTSANNGQIEALASGSHVTVKSGTQLAGSVISIGGSGGGTLSLESTFQGATSALNLSSNGTIDGGGQLDVGTLNWSGGRIAAGTIRAAGGTISSGSNQLLSAHLENSGLMTWLDGNTDIDATGGVLINQASGTFEIKSTRNLLNGTVTNNGLIKKTSVDETFVSRATGGGSPIFVNNGTVDVQLGTLNIGGGGVQTGQFNTSASSLLIFDPGASNSSLTFASGSLNGNITFASGTSIISGAAIGASDLTLRGNTVLQIDNNTQPVNSFSQTNGTLQGSGLFQVKNLNWTQGFMKGSGKTLVTQSGQWHTDTNLDLYREFENQGNLVWSGSDGFVVHGADNLGNGTTITNKAGATFEINGARILQDGSIVNQGIMTKTGVGTAYMLAKTQASAPVSSFTNTGTVSVLGGMLQIMAPGQQSGRFSTSNGGSIRFLTSGPNSFNANSALAGTINFAAGSHLIRSGASIEGASLIIFDNLPFAEASVSLTIEAGVIGTMSSLEMNSGTLDRSGSVQTNSLRWSGGSIAGNGTLTTTGGSIGTSFYSKFLSGSLVNASGTLAWDGGSPISVLSGGSITNSSGATFRINGPGTLYDGKFFNQGTLLKSGGGVSALNRDSLSGTDEFSNTGTIQVTGGGILSLEASKFDQFNSGVLSGGAYVINANSQLRLLNGTALQDNVATITLDGAGARLGDLAGNNAFANLNSNHGTINVLNNSVITIDDDIGNSGTMSIGNSGTLAVNGRYTQSGANSLTIVNGLLTARNGVYLNGGRLRGNGNIGSAAISTYVENNASIISAGDAIGTLTITGNYVQNAGGSLLAELQSIIAFDKLQVNGNVTLGGTLDISRLSGFSLAPNSSFDIITFTGTRTGRFTTVNGLSPGLHLIYLANSVQLRGYQGMRGSNDGGDDGLVPEPATLVAFAVGGLALPILRRRRRIQRFQNS